MTVILVNFWLSLALPQKALANCPDCTAAIGDQTATEIAQWAKKLGLDKVWEAWQKVQSTLQTGYQKILTALGIEKAIEEKIEKGLKWTWGTLRKMLLNMLVDDIVKWVQGGGKPRVITDWQSFLKTAADKAGGQFIEQYLKMGYLCSPVRTSLQILLATPPTFEQATTCTISKVVSNIENFFNDFSEGGWKAWLTISEIQNNLYGAYLYGLDQKWGMEAEAAKASQNEGVASAGFLGDKICREIKKRGDTSGNSNMVENYTDNEKDNGQFGGWQQDEIPEGYECARWETRTPGKIVSDAVSRSVTMDIDWLINADEFNEYLSAIATAVVNRVIREGVTMMTTSGGSAGQTGTGISEVGALTIDTASYEAISGNRVAVSNILDKEKLYKENLESLQAERRTNIDLLNQVQSTQESAFSVLREMILSGCSAPGTNQTNLGTQISGTCNANYTNCPCSETKVQSTRLSAQGIGEAIYQNSVTTNYGQGGFDFGCSQTSSNAITSISVTNSTAASEIADLNNQIAATQIKIDRLTTAIADMEAYNTATQNYLNAYSLSQKTKGDDSDAKDEEAAAISAQQKALLSSQAALDSMGSNFAALADKLQTLAMESAADVTAAQSQRGFDSNCKTCILSAETTYYKLLCGAQKIKNDWQIAYDSCRAPIGF